MKILHPQQEGHMSRDGQVWVGEFEDQGAYLVLWCDDLRDGEKNLDLEQYRALDLLTGLVTSFIMKNIESDGSWTRYM